MCYLTLAPKKYPWRRLRGGLLIPRTTNVSIRRGIVVFSTLYICGHFKILKWDIQNKGVRFRENIDNKCASLHQFTFLPLIVIWCLSPKTALSILVIVLMHLHSRFYKLEALAMLGNSLQFCSHEYEFLSLLFDATVETPPIFCIWR